MDIYFSSLLQIINGLFIHVLSFLFHSLVLLLLSFIQSSGEPLQDSNLFFILSLSKSKYKKEDNNGIPERENNKSQDKERKWNPKKMMFRILFISYFLSLTSIFTFFFFGEIRLIAAFTRLMDYNNSFSFSFLFSIFLSFLWIGAQFPQEKFLSYGRILTLDFYFLLMCILFSYFQNLMSCSLGFI